MSRDNEFSRVSQGLDVCSVRMRYDLPCKDCIHKDTGYCKRRKKHGYSKEKGRRAENKF